MSESTTERDIELATIRQGVEIERELRCVRVQRLEQELQELRRFHGEDLPAASAASPGVSTDAPGTERDAAGELYRQVHVFPKGRWS